MLVARPPAGRERECVCVCVTRHSLLQRHGWGFVTGVRLEAAGTRTGKRTKVGCILAFLSRSQERRVMYMYAGREAMF